MANRAKGKVVIKWNSYFAYALGLIVTDGCLYSNGRHIDFTSKDKEQIDNFLRALSIKIKIGIKTSGSGKKSFRVQFGDVLFFKFLVSIGITPKKSKTLGEIKIPDKYFFDFLRGVFDGDGYSYSYWDKRWRSSFLFYLGFCSASFEFIKWLQKRLNSFLAINGHVTKGKNVSCYQLKYAKSESLKIIRKMYYSSDNLYLSRKYLKIKDILSIMGKKYNMHGW